MFCMYLKRIWILQFFHAMFYVYTLILFSNDAIEAFWIVSEVWIAVLLATKRAIFISPLWLRFVFCSMALSSFVL